MSTKNLLISLLAATVVPALFWIGGMDFDTRGMYQFMCAYVTVAVFVTVLGVRS